MPLTLTQQPPYYSLNQTAGYKITITNSQILTLPTAPIQILPGAGAGKAILLQNAILKFNNAANYGNVTNNILILQTDSTPFNVKQLKFMYVGLADSEPITYSITTPFGDTNYALPTQIDNVGIAITSQNTGDFTGGNVANTIELTLFYQIVSL